MRINYNGWFYQQHRYLTGSRNGIPSYNDTKWNNIRERLQTLTDLQSTLIREQPYGVVSNRYGFDQLIGLLDRSDYTFSDVDATLVDTYKMSLKNAMSNMVVNTHVVIGHEKSTNLKTDPSNYKYYLVDIPYQQMHFGERDEMIRQQLQNMFKRAEGNYVNVNAFVNDEICGLLDFGLMCTANGLICNDWDVALDDNGLHFRIAWTHPEDAEFIVYKFDKCMMKMIDTTVDIVRGGLITGIDFPVGLRCIVDLYDERYADSVLGVPAFGVVTQNGLKLIGVQDKAFEDWARISSGGLKCIVYGVKYLFEVPSVFPAVNFYDMMYTQRVYTEKHENVMVDENKKVVGQRQNGVNTMDVCTPPIAIDRPANTSFDIVVRCSKLDERMKHYTDQMKKIGQMISERVNPIGVLAVASPIIYDIKQMYLTYLEGAIITSMVSFEDKFVFTDFVNRFDKFMTKLQQQMDVDTANAYAINEFYGNNYVMTVDRICAPFQRDILKRFHDIPDTALRQNYFDEDWSSRFNRPVSEQCFFALKWDDVNGCWKFTNPDIRHFHGIGNTFYISNDLIGNELFKFFVLYTDTENTGETSVEPFDFGDVIDFDKFMCECDKHLGYIRYWNVENHLRKLSLMMYGDDDVDKQTQVLSAILHKKLDGNEFLDEYPSDINYEPSNASSDNLTAGENDIRGPFAVNFLFYTVSMLYDNKDQLISYFLRRLTKSESRYQDRNINDQLLSGYTCKVNLSDVSYFASDGFVVNDAELPEHGYYHIAGLPMYSFHMNGSVCNYEQSDFYRYVFNKYPVGEHIPVIDENGDIDPLHYVSLMDTAVTTVSIHDEMNAIMTKIKYKAYLDDFMNYIETDYVQPFTMNLQLMQILNGINHYLGMMENPDTTIHDQVIDIINTINQIRTSIPGNQNVFMVYNRDVLGMLKYIYTSIGFDDYVNKRIRALYLYVKKLNTGLNLYEFEQWLDGLDVAVLDKLDGMIATNENFVGISPDYFHSLTRLLKVGITNATTLIGQLRTLYESIQRETFPDIPETLFGVDGIVKDLYTIDHIEFTNTSVGAKPYECIIDLGISDHGKIVCHVVAENDVITKIVPVCEYAFWEGDPITVSDVAVMDIDQFVVGTISSVTVSFRRVGTNADMSDDFDMIPNTGVSPMQFTHLHQTIEDGVNSSRVAVNYELLHGNHFKPLDHTTTITLNPNSLEDEPIDNVPLDRYDLNRWMYDEYQKHHGIEAYVKPCQVLHLEPINEDGVIESVGGRYHVGQTLYLKTTDSYQHVFPVIVTAMDHNEEHGFIEARVDYQHAKWNKIALEDFEQYFTTPIECEVIDDNISNFLDEFSDEISTYYPIPPAPTGDETIYTLPGDPCYVAEYSSYVYTRLDWLFHQHVPNRFIDNVHELYHFVYFGCGAMQFGTGITMKLINHDFNTMTDPELYPVLRDEPNDHAVHKLEQETFQKLYDETTAKLKLLGLQRETLQKAYDNAETDAERTQAKINLDECDLHITYQTNFQKRLMKYIQQPEFATTWYNVNVYDDAMLYINNGRAKMARIPIKNIRDITMTDQLEIWMYDWEHKVWLDTNDFDISINTVNNTNFNTKDVYLTNECEHTISIYPNDPTFESKQILIYFAYRESDIYEGYVTHSKLCNVFFKTMLDIPSIHFNPYGDMRIRKHFDTTETYRLLDHKEDNRYIINRIRRTEDHPNVSMVRWGDVTVQNGGNTYTMDDFDVYVKFAYPNITTNFKSSHLNYMPTIQQEIDGYTENEIVTLICMQNNANVTFDGNTSSILFTAKLENNGIRILDSNLPLVNGTFICTVAKHPYYQSCGGVIQIITAISRTNVTLDDTKEWCLLRGDISQRRVPDTFMLIPHGNVPEITNTFVLVMSNIYEKDTADTLSPYMYYYDTNYEVRYPISNIRYDRIDERLEIDQSLNTDVQKIKSNYIGICRFALQKIPENGLIDMIGYLPTPLTRERYEFWVNGRCLTNSDNLTILSPTAIQLKNLTSLRNFECIELVDDVDVPNVIMPTGTLYMDLQGNTFTSYPLMLAANQNTRYQSLQYRFYGNLKSNLDHYQPIDTKPNNLNIEPDILSYIQTDDVVTSYKQLFNLPTINGVTLKYPTTTDLGIMEIPYQKILDIYNETWKKEICTNSLFPLSHMDLMYSSEYVKIKCTIDNGEYRIYTVGICDKFFSLYIADTETGSPEQIIPMLSVGTAIILPTTYRGKWIQCTFPGTDPIELK